MIFDFDGTLVDSAGAKRQAFFDIFPAAGSDIVEAVLRADPDGNRVRVIPRMVEGMRARGVPLDCADPAEYVARYGEISERAVSNAPELPGASDLLRTLSARTALHLCSNTPEETVRRHVAARGWAAHFLSVDGYPTTKQSKIGEIVSARHLDPGRVAMVGDGISDEEAAAANRCAFFAIRAPGDLARVGRLLEGSDV